MDTASARAPDLANHDHGVVGRPHTRTDAAVLHVIRVVLDEAWSPSFGANRLLEQVDGDLGVLRRARARVLRGATERSTGITERALVTLDLALRAGTSP